MKGAFFSESRFFGGVMYRPSPSPQVRKTPQKMLGVPLIPTVACLFRSGYYATVRVLLFFSEAFLIGGALYRRGKPDFAVLTINHCSLYVRIIAVLVLCIMEQSSGRRRLCYQANGRRHLLLRLIYRSLLLLCTSRNTT